MPRRGRALKRYPIDQCALFKLGSIRRLAEVLEVQEDQLSGLLQGVPQYNIFETRDHVDPFSGKHSKPRKVHEPYGLLKQLHKRILRLLEPVFLPSYSHAAVKGKSYRTNADAHKDQPLTVTFDIENFYGSTRSHLIYYFFKERLRCAPDVAGVLTKLTTIGDSIPTGSPLSPLLSLHAARPMLDSLAEIARKHDLIFTCYIDDLAFSGSRIPRQLSRFVEKSAKRYGYSLHPGKSAFYSRGAPKKITGIIVHNGKLTPPFSRFLTARRLSAAINKVGPSHGLPAEKLYEKLAGLLGETAFIDPRYKPWASQTQAKLNELRRKQDALRARREAELQDPEFH